jgi:hypothetical protein
MPSVEVAVEDDPRPALAVGDTVFAAVAAAAWVAAGLPSSWPVDRGGLVGRDGLVGRGGKA